MDQPSGSRPSPIKEDVYALVVTVPIQALPAELIVLPDRQPCEVQAELTRTAPLEAGWEEIDVQWHWETEQGQLIPALVNPFRAGAEQLSTGKATFYPPAGSQCVTLTARVVVSLQTLAGGRFQTARIEKTASVRVLTPAASATDYSDGWIDGFEIGKYLDPSDPVMMKQYDIKSGWHIKYPEKFKIPEFLYKVDEQTKNLLISPNITLGFWAIDYPWKTLGIPQYIALDMNLVTKLEDLRDLMIADGFKISRFAPVYGFRCPAFNLGTIREYEVTNLKEPFSQHQYGRAVDLIIDENGDGVLDDLNGDGVSDIHDAAVIMYYVNQLDKRYRDEKRMEMVGGAGLYTHNDFVEREQYLGRQSAYIHIDTRGFLRDNGTLVRWPDTWEDTGGPHIFFGRLNKSGFEDPAPAATPSAAVPAPKPLKTSPQASAPAAPAPKVPLPASGQAQDL